MKYGLVKSKEYHPLVAAILGALVACHPVDYPRGKDTVAWYAGGRFQILRMPDQLVLYDTKNGRALCNNVLAWRMEKVHLLLICSNVEPYCVLDLLSGRFSRSARPEPAVETGFKELQDRKP